MWAGSWYISGAAVLIWPLTLWAQQLLNLLWLHPIGMYFCHKYQTNIYYTLSQRCFIYFKKKKKSAIRYLHIISRFGLESFPPLSPSITSSFFAVWRDICYCNLHRSSKDKTRPLFLLAVGISLLVSHGCQEHLDLSWWVFYFRK